jgi:glycosyltransferase involved in cell wall biosynthesis
LVISFVVPALNEAAYLPQCIHSIKRLKYPTCVSDVEIFVVDTGSTDQTLAIAATLDARVLQISGATVAGARNRGAQEARGEILAFVDADCELPPDWLVYGMRHLEQTEIAAIGTSLMRPPSTATWVERHWHRLGYATPHAACERVRWLPTSNLLVRRDAFQAVDGFDESLITCEDCDFGYRLSRVHTLILENRVQTRHLRESRTMVELFKREWWRGLGNLRTWRQNGWDRREFGSVAGPFLFTASILAALLTATLATTSALKMVVLSLEAIAAGVIPFLMLVKRGLGPHTGMSSFISSFVLACVYLSARGLALFHRRKAADPVAVTKVQWDSRT